MKYIAPLYYRDFECIASACRNSCCVFWEVDIDADTLARYESMSAPYGEKIRESIDREGEAHFVLDSQGRCPHLTECGLCRIITECGEDALSDICRDHPRYRSFYDGVTEIGLGLSCEEATRLALDLSEPIGFLVSDSEDMTGAKMCREYPTELFCEDERPLLEEKRRLMEIALDGERPLSDRLCELLPVMPDAAWVRALYLSLECLDSSWREAIEGITDRALCRDIEELSPFAERIVLYVIYRHATAESFYEPCTVGAFAALTARIVLALSQSREDIPDVLRAYSSEIEYSTENTERILDALEELLA